MLRHGKKCNVDEAGHYLPYGRNSGHHTCNDSVPLNNWLPPQGLAEILVGFMGHNPFGGQEKLEHDPEP